MIDWNPARSGSLTVRQHQSWYSPALHRNPMKENPSAEVGEGVKSGTELERGETDKSHHDKDHDRLESILPPDICLSGTPSFLSLSFSDCFPFLETHHQLALCFLIHAPLLCVSQQCPSKLSKLCGFYESLLRKLVLIKSWWHCLTVWLLHY